MDYIPDKDISNTVKHMTDTRLLFSKTGYTFKEVKYKTYRDELFYRLLNGMNNKRAKLGFKEISKARLAIAINRNPFLKKDDGELELLIKECENKGNYKKAYYILFK